MNSVYDNIIHYAKIFVKKAEEEVTNVGGVEWQPAANVDFELPEGTDQYTRDIFNGQFNLDTYNSISEDNKIKYYIEKTLPPQSFDLELLRQLDGKHALYYVEHLLSPVSGGKDAGRGSGRLVYDLGDKVLKLAYNQSGLYQNTMESRIANRNEYFADVYDVSPSNQWIISEKITPFESGEFAVVTGIPETITAPGNAKALASLKDSEFDRLVVRYDLEEDAADLLKEMSNMIRSFGVIAGDIMNPEHWGRSSDGKIKLYDYGLDSYGHDKFYDKSTGLTKESPSEEEQRMLWEFVQKGNQIPEEHENMGVIQMAALFENMIKKGI